MNPAKVVRKHVKTLIDLPNIGRAMAAELHLLGIHTPEQLKGRDPYVLYQELAIVTGRRQDPCVLDTFISITRFMDGGEALPWWTYTAERKMAMQQRSEH
ncbi:MAG: helix-hairpin-helix domain-containing protein [Betaproteobacteria bacterium]|nr:helix-hairpin-helix domain-containing protein [Betaproteobacteria bacterium]